MPIDTIAGRLGRHRSTIHREILRREILRRDRVELEPWPRRHRFREHACFEGHFPLTAQDLARERRQRPGKPRRDASSRDHVVVGKLKARWSPRQIAGRLRLEGGAGGTLCHETIHRHVYGPEGRRDGLYRHLPASRR